MTKRVKLDFIAALCRYPTVIERLVRCHLSPLQIIVLYESSKAFYELCARMRVTPKTILDDRVRALYRSRSLEWKPKIDEWLTGGSLLAILNGDPVDENSDLDIACWGSANQYVWDDGYGHECIEGVRYSVEDQMNGIQMITLRDSADIDDYLETFDFSFCRNAYNGTTLIVYCPDAVYTRSCTTNVDDAYVLGIHRWHITDRMIRSVRDRFEKYRERGYRINVKRYKKLRFVAEATCYAGGSEGSYYDFQDSMIEFHRTWNDTWEKLNLY